MTTLLDCGHPPSPHSEHTTGYATMPEGKRICWACAAEHELAAMQERGAFFGYTVQEKGGWRVQNWTGMLSFPVIECTIRTGRHNMAGTQTHFDFVGPEGTRWRGVQYGSGQRDHSKGLSDGYYCRCHQKEKATLPTKSM